MKTKHLETHLQLFTDDHADGGHQSYQNGITYCFNKNSILRRYNLREKTFAHLKLYRIGQVVYQLCMDTPSSTKV